MRVAEKVPDCTRNIEPVARVTISAEPDGAQRGDIGCFASVTADQLIGGFPDVCGSAAQADQRLVRIGAASGAHRRLGQNVPAPLVITGLANVKPVSAACGDALRRRTCDFASTVGNHREANGVFPFFGTNNERKRDLLLARKGPEMPGMGGVRPERCSSRGWAAGQKLICGCSGAVGREGRGAQAAALAGERHDRRASPSARPAATESQARARRAPQGRRARHRACEAVRRLDRAAATPAMATAWHSLLTRTPGALSLSEQPGSSRANLAVARSATCSRHPARAAVRPPCRYARH